MNEAHGSPYQRKLPPILLKPDAHESSRYRRDKNDYKQ